MKSKDVSPVDWYLVFALLKFKCGNDSEKEIEYEHIWENTYLVKANHPLVAFDKGLKIAKKDEQPLDFKGKNGAWVLAGIKQVLPVYEKIEDGAELFWTDLGKKKKSETENKIITRDEFSSYLNEKL